MLSKHIFPFLIVWSQSALIMLIWHQGWWYETKNIMMISDIIVSVNRYFFILHLSLYLMYSLSSHLVSVLHTFDIICMEKIRIWSIYLINLQCHQGIEWHKLYLGYNYKCHNGLVNLGTILLYCTDICDLQGYVKFIWSSIIQEFCYTHTWC